MRRRGANECAEDSVILVFFSFKNNEECCHDDIEVECNTPAVDIVEIEGYFLRE
mgnify:FL=1